MKTLIYHKTNSTMAINYQQIKPDWHKKKYENSKKVIKGSNWVSYKKKHLNYKTLRWHLKG